MDLLSSFLNNIKQKNLFHKKDHLVIAVSGGVDSMVLCHLCAAAGFEFNIAHCNFQLRGAESDGDEDIVKEMAANLEVQFFHKKFDTKDYKTKNKLGTQEAARELRYTWFAEIIRELKNKTGSQNVFLLTAHHANDNAETILYNFLRGTGVSGLAGIPSKRDFIRRPLLFATKEQIRDYALQHKIEYREDASNQTNDYSRNYLRNTVLPGLEKIFPSILTNLTETGKRFSDIKDQYNESIEQKIKKLAEPKGKELHIPVLKLQKTVGREAVLHEILKPFNFTVGQEAEVWKIIDSESGKYVNSLTHRVLKNRKWLIISPLQNEEQHILVIDHATQNISFTEGEITLIEKKPPFDIAADANHVLLDTRYIKFPLLLRKWKHGDYFYPLGMQKKKKLSRFFIDQKLSLFQKEKCFVIESDKKILWVVGYRIDDRFKVKPSTEIALQIIFLPAK